MSDSKLATISSGGKGANARENVNPRACDCPSAPPAERASRAPPRRKISTRISLQSARDVRAALCHSIHIGIPPNRHLTIDLEAAGAPDPILATGRFLKLLRDAARRRGALVGHVWVRECGRTVGDHVHILLHVPDIPRWFARRKAVWLKLAGLRPVIGGSRTRVIRGYALDEHGGLKSPALYARNLENLERYLLKHCSPEVQRALGISSHGPCLITGKRVAISQNLHRAARAQCSLCRDAETKPFLFDGGNPSSAHTRVQSASHARPLEGGAR